MSEEAVEALRKLYSSRTLTEAAEWLHPGAEMHQASAIPDADDYYGRDELVRGTNLWLEEWEDFQFTPQRVVDLGDQALMWVRLSGRAKASGIQLDRIAFHLWTFRDGMPWRCEVFLDEYSALEAAGLPE